MKYIYDHDLHIHSVLSLCSGNPEQNPQRILKYAKDNNLKTICITDHFWHSEEIPCSNDWYAQQNMAHIKKSLPLPQAEGINFLFGCETELSADFTLGVTEKDLDELDFIVIPTDHFHIRPFVLRNKDFSSAERRAESWYKHFEAVLDMALPWGKIGLAHLAISSLGGTHEEYLETLATLDENEMKRLFTKAAKVNAGIELNYDDMNYKDKDKEAVLRMFKIAKECGCRFYLGSDAHSPDVFSTTKAVFEKAINDLELQENNKFIPKIK